MKKRKIPQYLISIVTVCSILAISIAVIAYGRGYRLDINNPSIQTTGLISSTSDPIGAQVFVNGELKTATNNSFAVKPGWYTVTITKEGYISWQKQLRVQGEVVSRADAYLFPSNPSLSPLTTLGIERPILSPDGSKVAYIIPKEPLDGAFIKKSGLWVYELSESPLGRNRDPIQIITNDPTIDLSTSEITWSPDSSELLVHNDIQYRLYQINRPTVYSDVSFTYNALFSDWTNETNDKLTQKLEAFEQPIVDIATSSARILSVSPDETKILYEATGSATIPIIIKPPLIGTNPTDEQREITPGKLYVYDSKEDKNYFLLSIDEIVPPDPTPIPTGFPTPSPTPKNTKPVPVDIGKYIHWFPTSKHILLTLKGKIDIMEYDRTNWTTIYSGPFVDGFVAPWSNGSRIIILTNLNGKADSLPNLYTVNLR